MEYELTVLLGLIFIALLLFANAFFVASEFAFVSVRKTRVEQLSKEGNKNAELVLDSITHIDRSIAAVQLGITISSIGLGWVGEATIVDIIYPIFQFLPDTFHKIASHSLAVTISFALITLLHVVIGELMPKSIALQDPEKTSLVVARPMYALVRIFKPFIWILNGFGTFLLKLLKVNPATVSHAHSVEEIDMIIDASHKEGVLNDTEKEILQNVFKFSDTQAKQVMVPRPDVVAIEVSANEDDLTKLILENQYTRYPVYDEDIDHILGILHVKDIHRLVCQAQAVNLRKILREAIMVPETITMDNLVLEFKGKKSQLAIVVDEFGSTSGIITLEDVLEEIFGDVQDEFDDEEEAEIRQIYENEYILNAMVRLDEFNEYFNVEFEDEDVETIGGLVVKHLGHIAQKNDEISIENFDFKVLDIDNARVVKLKVIINKKEEDTEAEND